MRTVIDAVPIVLAVVAGLAYARRCRTLARRGRGVPAWRRASFYAGLALLAAVLSPPFDAAVEHAFYMHMVQHLTIGDLAPLALLLGLSGPVLRPLLARLPVRSLRRLANPVVALPLWAIVFYAWHLPALYEAALADGAVHVLEHALFFSAGLLMWAAVLEPLPGPAWFGAGAKAAYVLAVRTLSAVLANVFLWAGTPLYPGYAAGERAWGISPLADQRIGGGIMLVEGAIVTLVVFSWLTLRWLAPAPPRSAPAAAARGKSAT